MAKDEPVNGIDAQKLLTLITCRRPSRSLKDVLSVQDLQFLTEMFEAGSAHVTHWRVTGSQLARLRK